MSPKAKKYPTKDGNTAQVLREAAAAYGIRRDVLGVREAKNQLSALLLRAARGEEIVITSDGQPRAMIVRYRPVVRGKPWKSLADFRAAQPMQPDSAPLIDDARADRL
jgi:prevent-host-death family protein